MSNPGTLVLIGLNSPRTSADASGLRSYMSMFDGPPPSRLMMSALGGAAWVPALARRRRTSASVKPATPRAPSRRKLRREMLSQSLAPVAPQKVSMIGPLYDRLSLSAAPVDGLARSGSRRSL